MPLERHTQTAIIDYLKGKGAYVINIPGTAYQPGIPDLLVCYKGTFIALEGKAPNGSVRPAQNAQLRLIRLAEGVAEVVYTVQQVREIIERLDKDS